jgi:hypothetical protein
MQDWFWDEEHLDAGNRWLSAWVTRSVEDWLVVIDKTRHHQHIQRRRTPEPEGNPSLEVDNAGRWRMSYYLFLTSTRFQAAPSD